MKRLILATLASGLAIAAATPASAAIFISYSTDGGATKTQLALQGSGPGNLGFTGTVAGYTLNLNATGMPDLTSPNFSTNTISVQSGTTTAASQLMLYFTQTDQTAFNGVLNSSFSVTRVTSPAVSVSLATFYNAANANGSNPAVAPGLALQSQSFSTIGSFSGNNVVIDPDLFSTTAVYTLNFGAGTGGRINAGVDVTGTAVPEPATWGMMIMGFGLMGGVLRRRKTTVAFA